jgi:hypothetical protein
MNDVNCRQLTSMLQQKYTYSKYKEKTIFKSHLQVILLLFGNKFLALSLAQLVHFWLNTSEQLLQILQISRILQTNTFWWRIKKYFCLQLQLSYT